MHLFRFVPFDEMRGVAVSSEKLIDLLMTDPREDRGIGDFVPVQVQDRQNGAISGRVQKFVGMPAGRQRPRLRFSIANGTGHDQVRVIEGGTEGMRQRVAQFAALMDRAGRLWRHVAWNTAGKGELLEQVLHARFAGGNIRIDFAVGSFEIGVSDHGGTAMPRTRDIDHVQVVSLYDPV